MKPLSAGHGSGWRPERILSILLLSGSVARSFAGTGFEPVGSGLYAATTHSGPATMVDRDGLRFSGTTGDEEWHHRLEVLGWGRIGSGMHPWQGADPIAGEAELLVPGQAVCIQYIASDDGVRQNFLVLERPPGTGPLEVRMRSSGDLGMRVTGPAEVEFLCSGTPALRYTGLHSWDASGRTVPSRMLANNGTLTIEVDDRGATYPIIIDPVSTTANTLLLAPLAGSQFGISSCTAGDLNGDGYSDVVVGAWLGSQGQSGEGLAYVYYGSSSGIPSTSQVTLQVDQAGAQFGCSVSTAGDVNGDGYSDLLVGARTWESSITTELSEGAVFLYLGSPTGISTTPALRLEPNHAGDNYGSNVATAGDINNDGYSDIIVGAYLAEYPTYQEGAVWIHLGGASGLSATPLHRLERNISAAHFGRSIACAGDVNGDGFSDIIVGAPDAPNVNPDAGAAFLWYGSAVGLGGGLNPAPSATLYGSTVTNGSFGWSVSTAGDVNGDGYSDVVVGAYLDNNGGQTNEGTARVFLGTANGISTTAAALLEGNANGVWFGRSVATAGDVNGDGYGDVMVGASLVTAGQAQEGAVRLFLGSSTGVGSLPALQWELNVAGANLGESINPAGDVNGDGYTDVVLGARIYGSGGAVAVFHGGTLGTAPLASMSRTGPAANAFLGRSVANAGDVNGDGYSDLLIGVPGAGNGGEAHLHYGSAAGPSSAPSQVLQNNVAGSAFGTSVASAGDVNGDGYADVIVGAPANGNGTAHIHLGGPSGLSTSAAHVLAGGLQFGASVAPAGDVNTDGYADVIVGAPGSGQAFVFHGSATGPAVLASTTISEPPASGLFGTSVCTAGDVNGDGYSDVIVGAPMASNGQLNEGLAFVYLGSGNGLTMPYLRKLEVNQAAAGFGIAVAGAGDVNGDGFFDVVVGADQWESASAQAGEGAAFVFHGSATGPGTAPSTILQRDQAGAAMGRSVAEAGDVNGDGYADIVVGSPLGDAGDLDEGLVHVFRGAPAGLNANVFDLIQPNVAGTGLGASTSGGGDLDGDGFSDVVAGAPSASPGLSQQGLVHWHRGNNAISIQRLTRQYNADLVTPMSTNSMDFLNTDHFGVGHRARSPIHRCRARLRWEVVFQGQPFTGAPITNSLQSTGTAATWTTLPVGGTELKQLVYKLPNQLRYKWRVRVEYDLAKLIDGQRFSRWFYGYANSVGDIGVLPVELLSFTGRAEDATTVLDWRTATEDALSHFEVERTVDGHSFTTLGRVEASGWSTTQHDYGYVDQAPPSGTAYYRLASVDLDGTVTRSGLVAVWHSAVLAAYPAPTDGPLYIQMADDVQATSAQVWDAAGRAIRPRVRLAGAAGGRHVIDLRGLSAGRYVVVLEDDQGHVLDRVPVILR